MGNRMRGIPFPVISAPGDRASGENRDWRWLGRRRETQAAQSRRQIVQPPWIVCTDHSATAGISTRPPRRVRLNVLLRLGFRFGRRRLRTVDG